MVELNPVELLPWYDWQPKRMGQNDVERARSSASQGLIVAGEKNPQSIFPKSDFAKSIEHLSFLSINNLSPWGVIDAGDGIREKNLVFFRLNAV